MLQSASVTNCVPTLVKALTGREVFCLARDAQGRIWAGTDGGLYGFVGSDWKAHPSCPKDLLLALAAGPTNTIWCGTYRSGLVRVAGEDATIYSRHNSPLPDTIISALACDSSGRVWAGTSEGLVGFDGARWTAHNRANSGLPSNRIYCLVTDRSDRLWIGTDAGVTRYAPD